MHIGRPATGGCMKNYWHHIWGGAPPPPPRGTRSDIRPHKKIKYQISQQKSDIRYMASPLHFLG